MCGLQYTYATMGNVLILSIPYNDDLNPINPQIYFWDFSSLSY